MVLARSSSDRKLATMTSSATIRYGDAELLAAIRAVALALGGTAPEKLSQPQFDRGRATVADDYPGLPTARAIYMRLNSGTGGRVPWASIVRAALAGGVSAQQTIAATRRSAATVPVDRRVVFFALTLVARELGVRTFGPDGYDATASRLRRTRRGALASLLPTANQLVTYAGDWDMALELAELDPRPAAHARPAPVRPDTVSVSEALGLYLEHHGSLASKAELRWFSQAGGFALANDAARPWGEFVAELREVWTAAGRWCPQSLSLRAIASATPCPTADCPGFLPATASATAGPSTDARTLSSTTGTPCPPDASPSRSPTAHGPSAKRTSQLPAASPNTAASASCATTHGNAAASALAPSRRCPPPQEEPESVQWKSPNRGVQAGPAPSWNSPPRESPATAGFLRFCRGLEGRQGTNGVPKSGRVESGNAPTLVVVVPPECTPILSASLRGPTCVRSSGGPSPPSR